MTTPQLSLTVRLNTSAADSRRGVVRLHPEALAALGLREWDAVALVGARRTAVVAGLAPAGTPTGTILLDDVVLSNTGLKEDATVVVAPVTVYGARTVTVTGSTLARQSIPETTLRQALLGRSSPSATRCPCSPAISDRARATPRRRGRCRGRSRSRGPPNCSPSRRSIRPDR